MESLEKKGTVYLMEKPSLMKRHLVQKPINTIIEAIKVALENAEDVSDDPLQLIRIDL